MAKKTIEVSEIKQDENLIKNYTEKNIVEKNPEFESALEELSNTYPKELNTLESRIYKKTESGKRFFICKLDYFPDESLIQEKYGPGEYIVYCYAFIDGKRKFLGSPVVNIYELKQKEQTPIQDTKDNSENILLEKLKAYREAGLIKENGNENTNTMMSLITNMMLETQKTNQAILLKMLEVKSDNKNDKILELLLMKALDKTDVSKEIDTILKIKDSLIPETSGDNDIFGNLVKLAPAFLQIAAQEKTQNYIPQNTQIKKPKAPLNIKALEEYINKVAEKKAQEIIDREFPPENEELEPNVEIQYKENTEPTIDKNPEFDISDTLNSQNAKINNNLQNKEMNIIEKQSIEQIKKAPEETKIKILTMYLNTLPYKQVLEFCLNYEIAKDKNEFDEYVLKSGFVIPEQYNEQTMAQKAVSSI